MNEPDPPIRVECWAGHRGEETPRRFTIGERLVESSTSSTAGSRRTTATSR